MKKKIKKGLLKAVDLSAIDEQSTVAASPNDAFKSMAKKSMKKGKKGKKKGGKKLTRQERAKLKLKKLVEDYKAQQQQYNSFVNRMEKWFSENMNTLINLFSTFDRDGDGQLSYIEFKSGMLDRNIPCNLVELHLLCTLLDVDGDEQIDYDEFKKGIRHFSEIQRLKTREVEKAGEEDEVIHLVGPWEPKWVKVFFRLITFEQREDHPAHFETVVMICTAIEALVNIICEKTGLCSKDVSLYSDKSRSFEAKLEEHKTLEEYGFRGGHEFSPKELLVYYDFLSLNKPLGDCPLLLCDHYFFRNHSL